MQTILTRAKLAQGPVPLLLPSEAVETTSPDSVRVHAGCCDISGSHTSEGQASLILEIVLAKLRDVSGQDNIPESRRLLLQ